MQSRACAATMLATLSAVGGTGATWANVARRVGFVPIPASKGQTGAAARRSSRCTALIAAQTPRQ